MSPTVFRARGFSFYFYSGEEPRLHIHVHHGDGEAKFWIEPQISLAVSYGLNSRQLSVAEGLIRENEHDIRTAWEKHFGS